MKTPRRSAFSTLPAAAFFLLLLSATSTMGRSLTEAEPSAADHGVIGNHVISPEGAVDPVAASAADTSDEATRSRFLASSLTLPDPIGLTCEFEYTSPSGPYPKLEFVMSLYVKKSSKTVSDPNGKKVPLYSVTSLNGTLTKWYYEDNDYSDPDVIVRSLGISLIASSNPLYKQLKLTNQIVMYTYTSQFNGDTYYRVFTSAGVGAITTEGLYYVFNYNSTLSFYNFISNDPVPGVGFYPPRDISCSPIYAAPSPSPQPNNYVIIPDMPFNFVATDFLDNQDATLTLRLILATDKSCVGRCPIVAAKGTITTEADGYRLVESVKLLPPGVYNDNDNTVMYPPPSNRVVTPFTSNGVAFATNAGYNYVIRDTRTNHVIISTNEVIPPDGSVNRVIDPSDLVPTILSPVTFNLSKACFDLTDFDDTPDPGPLDVFFMSDTTQSMEPTIMSVRDKAGEIADYLSSAGVAVNYGVGEYKDNNGGYYKTILPLTAIGDDNGVLYDNLNTWLDDLGSGAGKGGQLYALYSVATLPEIGWRAFSTKIVVLFGDEVPNYSRPMYTTEVAAGTLKARGIRLIAVDVHNLNKDKSIEKVTKATGGQLVSIKDSATVGSKILSILKTIIPKIKNVQANPGSCTQGASLSFLDYSFVPVKDNKVCFTPIIAFYQNACKTGPVTCTFQITDLAGHEMFASVSYNVKSCA